MKFGKYENTKKQLLFWSSESFKNSHHCDMVDSLMHYLDVIRVIAVEKAASYAHFAAKLCLAV